VRFEGTFTVRALRQRVWSFFLDPEEFSVCIDDPHTIESIDPDNFRGTVKTGIGFIRGSFKWSATIKERVSPERAQFGIHGSGMGSAFDVVATLQISEANGLSTVRWAADVQISGTIATVGARLLQGTTEKKTNAFFENARKHLEKP
jgi:carbon monoxide dehydrogenase subunit G